MERLAETDRKIAKYDRDIAQLEGRLAIPEVSVEKGRERITELRTLKHEALQQRAEIDQEKSQLDDVKKVLADFEPFFHSLDRKSQLEIVHRFARRIDLGVTNIVIHWRFSENECQVPRLEVSPRTRKRGERGRVVEIGGLTILASSWMPPTDCCSTCSQTSLLMPNDGLRSGGTYDEGEEQEREGNGPRAESGRDLGADIPTEQGNECSQIHV